MKYPTLFHSLCLSALLFLLLNTTFAHAAGQLAIAPAPLSLSPNNQHGPSQTAPIDGNPEPVAEPTAEVSGKPGLTIGQPVPGPVIYTDQASTRSLQAAPDAESATNAPPVITIWYGLNQTFGQIGTPIPWVNILGNVTTTTAALKNKGLVYSLNGGTPVTLGIGPDKRRLAEPGDFNVELDINDLNDGPNQVVITATDRSNQQSSITVTVNYTGGTRWPLPYTADWSSAATINQVAQIVDGQWAKQADGTIHATWLDYDRLVAIGDTTWTDYEVIAPVTIHAIDGEGFAFPSSGPGVGLLLRWPGHYQENGEQPYTGWKRLGALGWFRWDKNAADQTIAGLQMIGYNNSILAVNPSVLPEFETPYLMKMQVESSEVPGAGAYYRYKVWKAADTEPAGWQMEGQNSPSGASAGTLLLVAHHVNASFGNVTIRPLHEEQRVTLQTSVIGNGSIQVEPPAADYALGQQVTVAAQPDTGWQFTGWSGALQGATNPASLTLNADATVTATFTQRSYTLTTAVQGQGSIQLDPVLPSYPHGTVVTLTAVPTGAWNFAEWAGDLIGNETPVQITMNGPKSITAIFSETVPVVHQLTTTVNGEGGIQRDPAKADGLYLEGAVVTLTAQPAAGWQFTGWSGDLQGADNPATVVMDGARNVTATFTRLEYPVKVVILGNGNVARSADLPNYPHGTSLTLTATAGSGWRFVGWQGDLAGSNPVQTFVVESTKTVTATFVRESYTLTVNVVDEAGNPTAGGTVTLSAPADAQGYRYNETATLVAQAVPGWSFVGWRGALSGTAPTSTLAVTENATVTATFAQEHYAITARAVDDSGNPTAAGTVTISPPQSAAGYVYGETVTLTATGSDGWTFVGWSGALSATTATADFTVTGDRVATATFTNKLHSLAATVSDVAAGMIEASPQAPYAFGQVVTLTVIPANGWRFTGWSGDLADTANPATITLDGHKVVAANFVPIDYTVQVAVLGGVDGQEGGTVELITDKEHPYRYGDRITLNATPDAGYRFVKWTVEPISERATGAPFQSPAGDVNLTEPIIEISVTASVAYLAEFAEIGTQQIFLPIIY